MEETEEEEEEEDAAMASLCLPQRAGAHHMVLTHPSNHPKPTERAFKRCVCVSDCVTAQLVCGAQCLRSTLCRLLRFFSMSASFPTGTQCKRPPLLPPFCITRGPMD